MLEAKCGCLLDEYETHYCEEAKRIEREIVKLQRELDEHLRRVAGGLWGETP